MLRGHLALGKVTGRGYMSGCQVMCSKSTSIGKPLHCLSHNKVHLSSPVSNIVVPSHRQSSDTSSHGSNRFILSHSQSSKSIMKDSRLARGVMKDSRLARGVMKDSRPQQDKRTPAQPSRVPGDPPEREGERRPSSMIL